MSVVTILPLLSLLSLATAQSAPGISSNPGGIVPAGVRQPNITGFGNAQVLPARGGYAICVSGTVPVTASAQNQVLNIDLPLNQSRVSQIVVDIISDGSPALQQIYGGPVNVSGTYDIGISMCMPANGSQHPSTVQFLTHGVGFDRYYWDFAPGYSYVDFAAVQGYTTFFYDRLGVGVSARPDAIKEVQTPLEIAIAAELVRMLRAGKFGGTAFSHVVGVGHSFGSAVTQSITSQDPTLLDAAVLTGYSTNNTGQPGFFAGNNFAIAAYDNPYRFGNLSTGYLVSASAISNQIAFFHAPGFDPNVLSLADATKDTATFGEFLTTKLVVRPATQFNGPVAAVLGDTDLPFCMGNCTYPINKATATLATLYPNLKNATSGKNVYITPNAGHGINLHYSATRAYQFIQDFIKNAGF